MTTELQKPLSQAEFIDLLEAVIIHTAGVENAPVVRSIAVTRAYTVLLDEHERYAEALRAIVAMGDPELFVQASVGESRLEFMGYMSKKMVDTARAALPQEEAS